MTKQELISQIRKQVNEEGLRTISIETIERVLETFTEIVMDRLLQGECVKLKEFGTFTTVNRVARVARNPQTNTLIDIPKKTVPIFKFSALIKDNFPALD